MNNEVNNEAVKVPEQQPVAPTASVDVPVIKDEKPKSEPKKVVAPVAKVVIKPAIRRHKAHLFHAWAFFAFLMLIGISGWVAASFFSRSVFDAATNLAASIVPDEALSAAFLLERRAQLDADKERLEKLFVVRSNPVPLLTEIEAQAKIAGAEASIVSVAVAPYDGGGDPSFSDATAVNEDAKASYALVIVSLEAKGGWKPVVSFARALETLPYAARLERLKLSVEQVSKQDGKKGVKVESVWTLRAEVRAVAR